MFEKFKSRNRAKRLEQAGRGVIALVEQGDVELVIREDEFYPGRYNVQTEKYSDGVWSDGVKYNERVSTALCLNQRELVELAEKILERLGTPPEEGDVW